MDVWNCLSCLGHATESLLFDVDVRLMWLVGAFYLDLIIVYHDLYILNETIMIPSVAVPIFFVCFVISVIEVVLAAKLTDINIFFFNLCNSEFVSIYILIQCFESLSWSLPWG